MKQFSRFVLVGAVAAGVNVLARIAIGFFTTYEISIVIAFFVALTVAFTLNKIFVFRAAGDVFSQYGKFFFVNMLALGQVWLISVGLARYVFVAVDFTWHPGTVAHAIGVASPIITSYYGHKYLSFRTTESNNHSPSAFSLLVLVCLVCSLALILFSSIYVFSYLSEFPYWDQWELAKWVSHSDSIVALTKYLFLPHNEHIIATGKLFSIMDIYLFDGRNLFTVFVIYFIAAALSVLIAALLFYGIPGAIFGTIVAAAAFFSILVAIVQWENLLWGFQTHFYFVNFGALAILALSYAYLSGHRSYGVLLVILVLSPLTILSNGSGVLLVIPLSIILFLFRDQWKSFLLPAAVISASVIYFFYMVRGATKIGDPSLRTFENILAFLFTMLGGPFSTSLSICAALGAVAFAVWVGLGIFHLRQFRSQGKVDGPGFVLFCFAMFVLASAAAAAYARVTIGTGAALAPRYATPILTLWLGLGASALRIGLCSAQLRARRELFLSVCLVLAVASSAWMNVRPQFRMDIEHRFESIERAKFSVLSNVNDEQFIKFVYPSLTQIAGAIEYLRENRLSAFSDSSASSKIPGDVLVRGSSAPACSLYHVDKIRKISDVEFVIDGWVAHQRDRRAPLWVIVSSSSGRVLGFSRPLSMRPDVIDGIKAPQNYRGFSVPLRADDQGKQLDMSGSYILAAFNGGPNAVCRIDLKWSE